MPPPRTSRRSNARTPATQDDNGLDPDAPASTATQTPATVRSTASRRGRRSTARSSQQHVEDIKEVEEGVDGTDIAMEPVTTQQPQQEPPQSQVPVAPSAAQDELAQPLAPSVEVSQEDVEPRLDSASAVMPSPAPPSTVEQPALQPASMVLDQQVHEIAGTPADVAEQPSSGSAVADDLPESKEGLLRNADVADLGLTAPAAQPSDAADSAVPAQPPKPKIRRQVVNNVMHSVSRVVQDPEPSIAEPAIEPKLVTDALLIAAANAQQLRKQQASLATVSAPQELEAVRRAFAETRRARTGQAATGSNPTVGGNTASSSPVAQTITPRSATAAPVPARLARVVKLAPSAVVVSNPTPAVVAPAVSQSASVARDSASVPVTRSSAPVAASVPVSVPVVVPARAQGVSAPVAVASVTSESGSVRGAASASTSVPQQKQPVGPAAASLAAPTTTVAVVSQPPAARPDALRNFTIPAPQKDTNPTPAQSLSPQLTLKEMAQLAALQKQIAALEKQRAEDAVAFERRIAAQHALVKGKIQEISGLQDALQKMRAAVKSQTAPGSSDSAAVKELQSQIEALRAQQEANLAQEQQLLQVQSELEALRQMNADALAAKAAAEALAAQAVADAQAAKAAAEALVAQAAADAQAAKAAAEAPVASTAQIEEPRSANDAGVAEQKGVEAVDEVVVKPSASEANVEPAAVPVVMPRTVVVSQYSDQSFYEKKPRRRY